jgi:hypothetical protein
MIAALSVPYRNVDAADLTWTLDAPDEVALFACLHPVGPLDVEVRILGASHQVVVLHDGRILCRETVACREGRSGFLPAAEERELESRFRYEVRCDVRRLEADELPSWVNALRNYAEDEPGATIALFPSAPEAVTAVLVEPLPLSLHGVLWRTWHTYPHESGSGDVVATRTLLHRATPL